LGYPPIPEQFYVAGLLALFLNTAGYQAEVLRGGFQSVGQGQAEAARAIGMRSAQIFRHITLPQALRLVVLPMTNEWIALFKATAILSTWPILEILLQSEQLGVNEGHPIEAFIMLAAMYLLVNVTLGKSVTYVERKTRIPGLGTPGAAREPGRSRGRRRVTT
jgi:ABC-type amino acid transport system permease subunit